jgi:hypothetical protein
LRSLLPTEWGLTWGSHSNIHLRYLAGDVHALRGGAAPGTLTCYRLRALDLAWKGEQIERAAAQDSSGGKVEVPKKGRVWASRIDMAQVEMHHRLYQR